MEPGFSDPEPRTCALQLLLYLDSHLPSLPRMKISPSPQLPPLRVSATAAAAAAAPGDSAVPTSLLSKGGRPSLQKLAEVLNGGTDGAESCRSPTSAERDAALARDLRTGRAHHLGTSQVPPACMPEAFPSLLKRTRRHKLLAELYGPSSHGTSTYR